MKHTFPANVKPLNSQEENTMGNGNRNWSSPETDDTEIGSIGAIEFGDNEIGSGIGSAPSSFTTSGVSGISAGNDEPIKSTVQDTVQQVQDTVGQVAEQTQSTAGKVIEQAKTTATTKLEDQKNKAAESVANVAQAIHEAGRNMDDSSPLTEYVEKAAKQLQGLSGYLQDRDLRSLLIEVEHFARRQPTLFIGGGLLLGMLGARFLKSSSTAARNTTQATQPTRSAGSAHSAAYGSSSTAYGNTTVESFTTRGNYTTEGVGNVGLTGQPGSYGDGEQTIHSYYRAAANDTDGSEV